MQLLNWQFWRDSVRRMTSRPVKRVAKRRSGWGIESEQLENRALLSAANHSAVADQNIASEVRHVSRKAQPIQFPNVQGTWNLDVTSNYVGDGTVTMVQNGRTVTSTISLEGAAEFSTTARFKRRSPNELNSKSPRIEVPGVPIPIRVGFKITFPSGNLNPTTFNGSGSVAFVGNIATFTGTKV